MLGLNLSSRPLVKLPASAFPNRADIYSCDKCGLDITKNLRPGRAHVWKPMGPERYRCRCGQVYLTGATEWDHFSERERRGRIFQTIVFGILLSAFFAIPAIFFYLCLHYIFGVRSDAVVTAVLVAVVPFVWMHITFWPGVVASIWRTRIVSRVKGRAR